MNAQIDLLLHEPPFTLSPEQRQHVLLPLFRAEITQAAAKSGPYHRYVSSWPIPLDRATSLEDLPYLPVSAFKSAAPLSCLNNGQKARTVTSSATTGQAPSRIVIDALTAKAMSRGAVAILRDFIGPDRRPLLIVDVAQANRPGASLNARGAAIRALMPFATRTDAVLRDSEQLDLDAAALRAACQANGDAAVLVYGFTYVLWFHFVRVLLERGIRLKLRNAFVLHSGGWKGLAAKAVDKDEFNRGVAEAIGCAPERVIDFYGMVENIGVVYPDCESGHKHVPSFAEVIVRDPRTLAPVVPGQTGIVQVGSLLPRSFPGHLLLTDDLAKVELRDGCPCGRRGLAFRLLGRIPRSEIRGCGNVIAHRAAATRRGN